ncbi:PaaI family thioesterase [Nocardia sp. NPDC055321]
MTSSVPAIGELFEHIGFHRETDASGAVTWELPVTPRVVNTSGGLQGGLLATLADIAAGTAALEIRPPNSGVVTSDLSIRYFRAIRSGTARAVCTIVHAGRRSIVVQVEVIDSDGEVAALATVSFATVDFPTDRAAGTNDDGLTVDSTV